MKVHAGKFPVLDAWVTDGYEHVAGVMELMCSVFGKLSILGHDPSKAVGIGGVEVPFDG